MQPWKRLGEPEEIKVGWRRLTRKTFERPDGIAAEYVTHESLESRTGAVIALTADNQVVIAEQFRPGPEMIFQELPGGGINKGEDPKEAVMRELQEETGYMSDDVEFLGAVPAGAYSNDTKHYYLARNCRQLQGQALDDGEFVDVKLITIDELFENARLHKMGDISAIFLAYELLQRLKKGEIS